MDETVTPRILSRTEHPISRKNIDPDVLRILYRLHNHGFLAYLVGGCVRDLLLGKTPKDFDAATDAHPRQIRELFRNSRLIGRRFRLAHVYFPGGKYIEVSTFRRHSEFDSSNPETHPQADNTFGTPAEVVEATKEALRQGAPGGGFILSSSNSIHSAVKPENYQALLLTLQKYGRYPLSLS